MDKHTCIPTLFLSLKLPICKGAHKITDNYSTVLYQLSKADL